MQFDKLFLGNTKSDQRKYLRYVIETIKDKYDRFFVPCVCQFAIVKTLIEAGVPKEKIVASDISVFTNMLGFFITGQPIAGLNVKLNAIDDVSTRLLAVEPSDDLDFVAKTFYLIRLSTLRDEVLYEKQIYDHFISTQAEQIAKIKATLTKMREDLQGITYYDSDLRLEVNRDDATERDLFILNPPVFGKGYEKMFNSPYVTYEKDFQEFIYSKEFLPLYHSLRDKPATYIVYRAKKSEGIPPQDIYFGKEYKIDNIDYWAITKPVAAEKRIFIKNRPRNMPLKVNGKIASVFSDADTLTPDSEIKFVKVPQEVAIYYRDLFAHRLGDVKAEIYTLMLIDGKVFATIGFHARDLFSLKTDRIFEVYGFNANSQNYPRINRMMMMCITSMEFQRYLMKALTGKNRVFELKGLKTTCLTKYRKARLNNGILEITHREKLDNGMYRIVYDAPFKEISYRQIIENFLKENAEQSAAKNEE